MILRPSSATCRRCRLTETLPWRRSVLLSNTSQTSRWVPSNGSLLQIIIRPKIRRYVWCMVRVELIHYQCLTYCAVHVRSSILSRLVSITVGKSAGYTIACALGWDSPGCKRESNSQYDELLLPKYTTKWFHAGENKLDRFEHCSDFLEATLICRTLIPLLLSSLLRRLRLFWRLGILHVHRPKSSWSSNLGLQLRQTTQWRLGENET